MIIVLNVSDFNYNFFISGVQASQSLRSSAVFPGSFHTQLSCVIHQETRTTTASVEISRTTSITSARHIRTLEFPGHAVPVEIPQPVNLIQKPRHDVHKPVNLLEKSRYQVPVPVSKKEKPKPVEEPNPIKPVEKPKMICESDLVGQILLQGLNTSETQFPSLLSGSSVKSAAKPEKTLTKLVKTAEIKKSVVPYKPIVSESKVPTKEVIKSRPVASNTNTKSTVFTSKVAWDVNKVLASKSSVPEKRPSDVLADDVRDEMAAKRQRLSQWLHDHVSIQEMIG